MMGTGFMRGRGEIDAASGLLRLIESPEAVKAEIQNLLSAKIEVEHAARDAAVAEESARKAEAKATAAAERAEAAVERLASEKASLAAGQAQLETDRAALVNDGVLQQAKIDEQTRVLKADRDTLAKDRRALTSDLEDLAAQRVQLQKDQAALDARRAEFDAEKLRQENHWAANRDLLDKARKLFASETA